MGTITRIAQILTLAPLTFMLPFSKRRSTHKSGLRLGSSLSVNDSRGYAFCMERGARGDPTWQAMGLSSATFGHSTAVRKSPTIWRSEVELLCTKPALRDITLQGNTGTARPARENLRLAGLFVGTEMQRGKASFPHFRSVHYPYGTAQISVDPQLLASFEIKGKLPRTVIIVTVHAAYFHCSKALVRSDLWNPTMHVSRHNLPSAGQMHRRLSGGVFDGETYDRELPQRTLAGLY
ncbi:hypothetical protein QFZ96_002255 [Paraburkholderia youngii]